jgi:hypothetical protein
VARARRLLQGLGKKLASPSDPGIARIRRKAVYTGGGCMCCTWRPGGRWHGRQRRREVAGADRATAVSPRARGHALAGTRGHGPLWATGKRPCHFSDFFKIFHLPNFEIQNRDLLDVQNSLNVS